MLHLYMHIAHTRRDVSLFFIIFQWDLVCKRDYLPEMSNMVFNLGVMVGGMLFGFLSDKFGRKKSFISALLIQCVTGSVTALSPNLAVFTILRFIVGACEQVRTTSAACSTAGHVCIELDVCNTCLSIYKFKNV